MGIAGLLPFLEKAHVSRPVNIKDFKGCTFAADAYCWLHKGAFSCADKLARGEQTDMFVQYCMKYVNMLLANDIKPILVFDGRHLPAKAQTEKKRREKREDNRKQAANLLRQGHTTEALSFLRRCIDVTHKMALTVMQECRKRNVDCIVAPYEADAQLAYFSLEGIVDVVVTEDSDLLLFGCKKVIFKLDLAGNGVLVDQEKLYLSMKTRPENYSFERFRYMCILSGCDYLDSLPGVGLGKACKFITRSQDPDIYKAMTRLPSQLNMRGLTISKEYRDDFLKADAMFKHQLVFDPIMKKTKPLTPHGSVHPGSPLADGPLPGCVPEFDEETSYQLALGNLDPFKLEKVDEYNPNLSQNQNQGVKTHSWNQSVVAPHPSIWDRQYFEKMRKLKPQVTPSFMPNEGRPATKAQVKSVDTDQLLNSRKRPLEEDDEFGNVKRHSLDPSNTLTAVYSSPVCTGTNNVICSPHFESPVAGLQESPTSPILSGKRLSRNPFVRNMKIEDLKEPVEEKSIVLLPGTPQPPKQASKFGALSKYALAVQKTSTEGKPVVQSRYFGSSSLASARDSENNDSTSNKLCDVSNTMNDNFEKTLNMYKKSPEEQAKLPMVHRKPLFASISCVSKVESDTENDCLHKDSSFSSANVVKTMTDKFTKNSGPVLKKSPSKNPFKKNRSSEESPSRKSVQEDTTANTSFCLARADDNDDDADDPGCGSTTSLIQCSQSNDLTPPDDGLVSPRKAFLESRSLSQSSETKTPTRKQSKPSCRVPGLKKVVTPSQGQSSLRAFGFMSKPKIQRSDL